MGWKNRIATIAIIAVAVLVMVFIRYNHNRFRMDKLMARRSYVSISQLFNMDIYIDGEPTVPDPGEKGDYGVFSESWSMALFFKYLWQKITFQTITHKDVEPDWRLEPRAEEPDVPQYYSTQGSLRNFNDNLMHNPDYAPYCTALELPLTVGDLMDRPEKVMEMIEYLRSLLKNADLSELTNFSYVY